MSDTESCKNIRRNLVKSIYEAGSGHYGSSLSCVEILYALYFHVKGPQDKIILSKGHAAPALYATLAEAGLIDVSELSTLRQINSRLQGHPDRTKLPHLDAGTGALGQGLSMAVGYALAAKLDRSDAKVFCIVGDGELQEGQIWEAAMAAAHYDLGNLCCIVDSNDLQNEQSITDTMSIDNLYEKFEAFGWNITSTYDGHNVDWLKKNLMFSDWDCPYLVGVETTKGKGISFMEDDNQWHSGVMSDREFIWAMEELKNEVD